MGFYIVVGSLLASGLVLMGVVVLSTRPSMVREVGLSISDAHPAKAPELPPDLSPLPSDWWENPAYAQLGAVSDNWLAGNRRSQ